MEFGVAGVRVTLAHIVDKMGTCFFVLNHNPLLKFFGGVEEPSSEVLGTVGILETIELCGCEEEGEGLVDALLVGGWDGW